MKRLRSRKKYKEKFTIREQPRSALSPEEHLKAIANIIIDRIFEEAQAGSMPNPLANYGQPDQD